jgi:hypothetical protein
MAQLGEHPWPAGIVLQCQSRVQCNRMISNNILSLALTLQVAAQERMEAFNWRYILL